jgi:hypothetical protein
MLPPPFIQEENIPSPGFGEELDRLATPHLSPFDDPGEPSGNGDMKPNRHSTSLE